MPIRVLCCSGSLESGGSERQLSQLAIGLPADQVLAQIYLIYRRGSYLEQIPSRVTVHDFESQAPSAVPRWPGAMHRRMVLHLAEVIREQQIDVVYDRTFHMTLLTAAACRITRTPRVSVIVSPPSRDVERSRERFRWIKKRLLARAYRDPQCRCLAVSESVADDAVGYYGLPRQGIHVLPSPIDVAAVQRAAQVNAAHDARAVLQSPSKDACFRWLVVGRLSSEKGQRLAIEAMDRLRLLQANPSIELTLIGDGPERDSLVELVRQLRLQSRVHFAGQQANPYPLMRAAELLCIPSLYEGLPNVALEAMSLNTPIVATNCSGSLRTLLGDGRGAMIPVNDADALAQAVLDRIARPQVWQARANAAQQWVGEHHGLQPWLSQMVQIFEDLSKTVKRS